MAVIAALIVFARKAIIDGHDLTTAATFDFHSPAL
jgi:hypothetical protein